MRTSRFAVTRLGFLAGTAGLLSTGASAQDLPKIVVAGPPIDDFKQVHYGIKSGLFRRYGLTVETLLTNSGAAATAAVVGNTAQVAFTSVPGVLQAYVKGVQFRVVAPAQWYLTESATDALYVRKDSPLRTARDLNGKTIAVAAIKDLFWATVMAWIEQNGGDPATIKIVELPQSAVTPALEEGRIDAGRLGSPFVEHGVAAGKVRLFAKNLDAIAKRYQASVFVSTADWIAANPEVVNRFVRAMREAIVYTNTHLPETAELVASYSGVEAAAVARSVRAVDPEYLEAKNLQPVIDFSYKYKLIDRTFNASDIISTAALKPGAR
jgi:NitT/TauT family transport system substrate-binding protein